MKPASLLRDRNFILILAIILGLLWGRGAQWTEPITLPALAIIMTLSTMGIPGHALRPLSSLWSPALLGLGLSYFILGGLLLVLNALLVHDEALRTGFVIIAAVPPAIAVIPFTLFLNGDERLSLLGTIGAYLGGLILMPIIALIFLGARVLDPAKLIVIELILVPLILSRILIRIGVDAYLNPIKGAMTNWGFFLLIYTIVGLNRSFILTQPFSLLPVISIAVASTFFLGWAIEGAGRILHLPPKALTSLILLGTLKNYGLAGGLALALFNKETSVPATVSSVFMIAYILWLQFRKRKADKVAPLSST